MIADLKCETNSDPNTTSRRKNPDWNLIFKIKTDPDPQPWLKGLWIRIRPPGKITYGFNHQEKNPDTDPQP